MLRLFCISLIAVMVPVLPSCERLGPLESDVEPPVITAATPAPGATGVGLNAAISIMFSEPADESTIVFSLMTGTVAVPCSMNYSGSTAIFTPSGLLAYETLYTATVKAGVKDLSGNAMISDFVFTFRTGSALDTAPPNIKGTVPGHREAGVSINTSVSITFNEPVKEDTIFISLGSGGSSVTGIVSCSGATARFTPEASLAYHTEYTARLRAGAADLSGNQIPDDYAWTFTTGAAPDTDAPRVTGTNPASDAAGVEPGSEIAVTFSEPVIGSTVLFSLYAGTEPVSCTMTPEGNVFRFKPVSTLAYNTSYTALVKAGVTDLAGNPMPADYLWTFTTGATPDTQPPSVAGTVPASGAEMVEPEGAIIITFSEPVKEQTILFTLSTGSDIVICSMSYSGTTAVLSPSTPLAPLVMYTARVGAGLTDFVGNSSVSDYEWTFTTTGPQ